jgi:hypothetical protein
MLLRVTVCCENVTLTRTTAPPLPPPAGERLRGSCEVVARGNALGKGPVLFCFSGEGVANIKRLAAAGDERFAQLELDMYRLAGLFAIDRMREQFEVEVMQALTRAAPDFAAIDAQQQAAAAAAAAASADGGTPLAADGGASAGGQQPPPGARAASPATLLHRSSAQTARRSAWVRAKAAALFATVQQQLSQAELLVLAPGAAVTQRTAVLMLAGGLQCAPVAPEPAASDPARADSVADALKWLCSAGRHQGQALLPAMWEVLDAEDLAVAAGGCWGGCLWGWG